MKGLREGCKESRRGMKRSILSGGELGTESR